MSEGIRARERSFHDEVAAQQATAGSPPREPDHLEIALLDRAGDVRGRSVLELGCGTGDLTLMLLERGARVTAVDLSPAMVEIASARAERFRPDADAAFHVAPVEETGLPDAAFELVVGKWILHHADVERSADELFRVMAPGGRGVFVENSDANPVLRFARERMTGRLGVPRFGTPDEHPLVASDYEHFRRRFRAVALDYPDFCFFHLVDRQLLRFRSPGATRFLSGLDHLLWRRVPRVRPYSFHVLLEVER